MYISESFRRTWLASSSSPIDWCEPNYVVTSGIAEFTNTFSNVIFMLAAPVCMMSNFWRIFSKQVSIGADIQCTLLMLIALSSMYFHAKLSLLGQFFDEILILWAIVLSYASFLPNSFRPSFYHGKQAFIFSICVGIVLTALWFISPFLNAFFLMLTVIPNICMQHVLLKDRKEVEVKFLSRSVTIGMFLAVLVWVVDRTFCGTLLSLNIPGLHSIWHILSCCSFFLILTAYSFIKTEEEHPQLKPSVRLYPGTSWGFPYIYVREIYR